MEVLRIDVSEELLAHWVHWFAPAVQPFWVTEVERDRLGLPTRNGDLSAELRDTYGMYGAADGIHRVGLDQSEFLQLAAADRSALVRSQLARGRELVPSTRAWQRTIGAAVRQQADGHRFVWWPSLLRGHEETVLRNYVEEGRRVSRHRDVAADTWARARSAVPRAAQLAGLFPAASGPNCFGAVMGAAGVEGAENLWMRQEPFEDWLAAHGRRGGTDDAPGTVMVWRSPTGLALHAAITIGDGWALHKVSQGWMSPTKILSVADIKLSARDSGRRLVRYTIAH